MLEKIKLILKSVRQYKKTSIITPIFMMLEALFESALPFVMSIFVDSIIELRNPGDILSKVDVNRFGIPIIWIIVILLSLAMGSMTFGILGGRYDSIASVGMAANLRSDLYKKLQSFSFSNIDKFSSSSLITRMTTDVNNVQMAFQMLIRIVIRAPLMIIFSAVMAILAGGSLVFVFLGIIPFIIISLLLIGRGAIKIFMRVFKRYDALNQSVQENVSGIRVVKAYVREDFEKKKFNKASDSMAIDFTKAEKIVALNTPLMNAAVHLSNILILSIGTSIIFSTYDFDLDKYGDLSVGQLSSLITYGIAILSNLLMISMILVMLFMSLESVRRVSEVLKEEPEIKNPENPIMEINDGSVDFNNVSFKYKSSAEKNTLENIDVHIKSGQFIGILGSTGSGKTSVVNLISRLYDVKDGDVLVAGHNVKEYDLKALRDNVSVVLQKNLLFSGTIASNLKWGDLNATNEEMLRALEIAQATEVLRGEGEKGLERKVEQGGSNFSGGQKQRLCIARALMKKPKILILDDSTSAVDTKTDRLIRTALRNDLPKMTKIVIAQRISSIQDADQIIIMDDGKINAMGTHDELIKNNKIYQEVYYTQNQVGGEQ